MEYDEVFFGIYGHADTTLYIYTISGDTIINQISYHKLWECDRFNNLLTNLGFLREEDKKIYYRVHISLCRFTENEILLYDFTKQVGDTIKHVTQNGQTFTTTHIIAIDTILIEGKYRKRYKVVQYWSSSIPDSWVEGIGSITNGLLSL